MRAQWLARMEEMKRKHGEIIRIRAWCDGKLATYPCTLVAMDRMWVLVILLAGCSDPTEEVECGAAYGNQRATCEERCAEAENVSLACPGVGSCAYQAEYEGELGCCALDPFGDDLMYRWYACGRE